MVSTGGKYSEQNQSRQGEGKGREGGEGNAILCGKVGDDFSER
jgi:hypothetical protein